MQRKVVCAGTASRSFAEASALLHHLAELAVPAKQVERLTRRIGEERAAERGAAVAAFQGLPLAEKFGVPAGVTPPDLAVVMAGGGRLQILGRAGLPPTPPGAAATAVAPAGEEGWDEERPSAGHWREGRVGLLLTMASEVSAADPCPEVPPTFLGAARVPELARELARQSKPAGGAAAEAPAPAGAAGPQGAAPYGPPAAGRREVVASRAPGRAFAPTLAAAAWARGSQGAARQAFVADGAANDWRLQRRFFGPFVPVLDLIHVSSYLFAAAMAGRPFAAGWACYRQWIGWVWQGRVGQVIAAPGQRQAESGSPEPGEPEGSPRQVVAGTRTYLGNHQGKMRYDAYRRQGLPLTSSLMESVAKEVSRRVRGTEKFWSEGGAEAILQLRADHLSDDKPLEGFWQRRQEAATGQRRYRRAG